MSLRSSENQKQNSCTEKQIWHILFFWPFENRSGYKILKIILGWKILYITYDETRIGTKGYFSTEIFNKIKEVTFKMFKKM